MHPSIIKSKSTKWDQFQARLERLPHWVIPTLIAILTVSVALAFLWPSPIAFPMDDTYIHFVYAQNLATHGKLFFSFPDEKGVATSSLLWVLLLAGGNLIGIPMFLLAKILGIASLACVGVGIYLLMRPIWTPLKAASAALLVSLSGNMIWFSLSGMETMLFLALGILCLLSYRAGRWGGLGFLLGLLTLTRPDGLFLIAALGLVELFSQRCLRRGFVTAASVAVLLAAPWFLYLKWRTGSFLPTSAAAKQFGTAVAVKFLLEKYNLPVQFGFLSRLTYPVMWIGYLLEFALGGMALPPPRFTVGGMPQSTGFAFSLWAIPGCALIISLVYSAGRKMFTRQCWSTWLADANRLPIWALVIWMFLHNLAYMILLPIPGTASRYGALNYIVLWVAVVAGFSSFVKRPWVSAALAAFIALTAISNTLYWNRVYDANIEHMIKVRIAAAQYVRDDLPAEENCGAFDVGAMRYFSGRPIVELAALVDPQAVTWLERGDGDRYIVEHNVTCLILPGHTGDSSEGLLDFAEIMGLKNSPLFEMKLVKVFEIDHERWLLGYLPTVNYQASVTIYQLEPRK